MEMIDFRIKQKNHKGIIVLEIQAFFQGDWHVVCKGNRSMNDVREFFSTAKAITWNEDGLSGSYSF